MSSIAQHYDQEDHRRRYAVMAFILALLLQAILLLVVARVRITLWHDTPTPPQHQLLSVDRLTVVEPPTEAPTTLPPLPQPPSWQHLPEPLPMATESQALAGSLTPMPPAERRAVLEGLGRNILEPPAPVPRDLPPPVPPSSPPPLILAADGDERDPTRSPLSERLVIPKIPRSSWGDKYSPSLTSPNPSGGSGGGTEFIGLAGLRAGYRAGLPNLPPLPTLPDNPPPADGLGGAPSLPPPPVSPGAAGPPGDLNPLMQVDLTVYHDLEHGGGVYKLRIAANEKSDRLAAIPRDVLLLLDASASITKERLQECVKGLSMGLDSLGSQDRVNLVVFREKAEALFTDFQPADAATLTRARQWLAALRSTGKTDVYGSLTPFLTVKRADPLRPYLIFLVSDGESTTGERPETNEFLRRVSKGNEARGAIFTYLAGAKRNRFLMEFLAYRGRGYTMQAPETFGQPEHLARFLNRLAEIIVADPVCRVADGLDAELYPRELPHLFRGHPLVLYGRFPPGTKELNLQIEGRNREGGREALLLSRSLAEAPSGGRELELEWATQKIYFLLGERAITGTPEIRRQIDQLSKQYQILVPY